VPIKSPDRVSREYHHEIRLPGFPLKASGGDEQKSGAKKEQGEKREIRECLVF
jgi:hypothetical protein